MNNPFFQSKSKTSIIEFAISFLATAVLFYLFVNRTINDIVWYSMPENYKDMYQDFPIPDLMINYQGGFVRRGLIGEILYQLFCIQPYSVHTVIFALDITFLLILATISCVVFIKMKWFPILPLAIINTGIIWYRRDFLMISFAFLIMFLLFRYATSKKSKHLILGILLMNLSIIIYEPSFFFIVPISALIYWSSLTSHFVSRLKKTILVFSSTIVIMAIVCLSKGSSDIANAIWSSWNPLFDYIGEQYKPESLPAAIAFLGKGKSAVMFHINLNFHLNEPNSWSYIMGTILMLSACCFLTVNTPLSKPNEIKTRGLLFFTFVFQFVCLFPMFTVLSCDYGRTINYIIFTCYFMAYFVKKYDYQFNIPIIRPFETVVEKVELKMPSVNRIWLFLLILCFMPYNQCCGVPVSASLFHRYKWFVKSIIHLFV